jgi:hypothetical protein
VSIGDVVGSAVGLDVSFGKSVGALVGSQMGALVGQGMAHVIGAFVPFSVNTGDGCNVGITANGEAVTGTPVG